MALAEGSLKIDPALHDSPFATDHQALLRNREFSNLLAELITHINRLTGSYERMYSWIIRIDALVVEGNPTIKPIPFDPLD